MNNNEGKQWLSARVSRETMDRLELFHELIIRWQSTINLVASSTLDAIWARHLVDSAQIYSLADTAARRWLDLGSGAGLPGLVVGLMAADQGRDLKVVLVESDIRKCAFLREAARQMDISVEIHTKRISEIPGQEADVISARALAPLSVLLDHAKPHTKRGTCLLFPKGESFPRELDSLASKWQSAVEVFPSVTDPAAVVLRIRLP